MISLILDSSMQFLCVGLFIKGKCVESYKEDGNRKQSENIIPTLKSVLLNQGLSINDIDEVIVTIGPGTYTGVRIALTVAKTLATVSNIKIKVISSLNALIGMRDGISIIDARSNKAFIGVYSNGVCLLKDQIVNIDEIEYILSNYPNFLLYGDANLINQDCIDTDIIENMFNLSSNIDYIENVHSLVPLYIKEVEAKKIW